MILFNMYETETKQFIAGLLDFLVQPIALSHEHPS